MLFKIFKNKLLVLVGVILGVILSYSAAKGTDWWQVTGECKLGREVIIKKGTKIKMLTLKGGMIIIEEVVLKQDRKGTLMSCENGIFVRLTDCGNLVGILEKKVEEKIVIQKEPERQIYIERYIERPVYVTPPPPPPPPVIYAPPPPPIPRFYFHYEKRKIHISPFHPSVVTLPPRIYY
jgi:hypothetical protein